MIKINTIQECPVCGGELCENIFDEEAQKWVIYCVTVDGCGDVCGAIWE